MSQITRNGATGSGGALDTLTGNTGGSVGPDGASNINVLGGVDIEVVGDPGTNTLTLNYTGASMALPPLMTTFSANGTWTKDAQTTRVEIICINGGNGGGSGRRGASTQAGGGGGGASGAVFVFNGPPNFFSASETVTVGTGGAGGAAQTSDNTNGNSGAVGTISSVGNIGTLNYNTAMGTSAGSGGINGDAGGGLSPAHFYVPIGTPEGRAGVAGARGDTQDGSSPFDIYGTNASSVTAFINQIGYSFTPGAAGGGAGADDTTERIGGNGTTISIPGGGTTLAAGGVGGVESGTIDGTDGANGGIASGRVVGGAGGGAGGGQSVGGAAGNGGNGGFPGGAGGGGGGSLNGTNSGAGGDGGDGFVIIIEYRS